MDHYEQCHSFIPPSFIHNIIFPLLSQAQNRAEDTIKITDTIVQINHITGDKDTAYANSNGHISAVHNTQHDTITKNGITYTYMYMQQMPIPGCDVAAYIVNHLHYPAAAKSKRITGRVVIKFEISTTGKIINPTIVHSIEPTLDSEALRIISNLPDWVPGKNAEGVPAQCSFMIPVNFKI